MSGWCSYSTRTAGYVHHTPDMKLSELILFSFITVATAHNSAAASLPDQKAREEQILKAIDAAQLEREQRLVGYSVAEHYTIRNSHFSVPAETTTATTYAKDSGKTYRVVSRSGPALLQTHVLDRLLKEETDMSRGEGRKNALVTSANYAMKLAGQETVNSHLCDLVELTPRVKSAHLLKGRAWMDSATHILVRIEGQPTASPAFLAGRPEVVRDYTEIDGFSLASKSRALSETFLLGKTELTIEYAGYSVNSAVKTSESVSLKQGATRQ